MMTEKQAEVLRDKLSDQVAAIKDPPGKAIICIVFGGAITFRFVGMGPGESLDKLNLVRAKMLELAKEAP